MQHLKNLLLVSAIAISLYCCKSPAIEEVSGERPSVTFIAGEDKNAENPYYYNALQYYKHHTSETTGNIVTDCRTLKDIWQYLETHHTATPWGCITIVAHGNAWTGLGFPIEKGSERSSANAILNACEKGILKPFNRSVIDAKTIVKLQGCAIGEDLELMDNFKTALGSLATIEASPYFHTYASPSGRPADTEHYLSKVFYVYYPTASRPSDADLCKDFIHRYPSEKIDWSAALSKNKPQSKQDVYSYFFNVPIHWTVILDETTYPNLETPQEQLNWLKNQTDLMTQIDKTHIPLEKFRWKFSKDTHTFEEGTTKNAITIDGKTTIMCVLVCSDF